MAKGKFIQVDITRIKSKDVSNGKKKVFLGRISGPKVSPE
jgi:hypothetical protein